MLILIFLDVSLAKCRIVDTATLARAAIALRHLRRARRQLLMIDTAKRPRRMLNHMRNAPGRVTGRVEDPPSATDINRTHVILPIRLHTLATGVSITDRMEGTRPHRESTSIHHPHTACTRAHPTLASGAHTTHTSA